MCGTRDGCREIVPTMLRPTLVLALWIRFDWISVSVSVSVWVRLVWLIVESRKRGSGDCGQ